VGGVVAIATLQVAQRFSGRAILAWTLLYAVFVGYVLVTS
jgi:hypothetical protein